MGSQFLAQVMLSAMNANIEHDINLSVTFRGIESSDFQVIKDLHEELFPVNYSDAFYQNTCDGVGIGGGKIYSSLAVVSGQVIGFILAQMMAYPSRCEDKDLIFNVFSFKIVAAVMTADKLLRSFLITCEDLAQRKCNRSYAERWITEKSKTSMDCNKVPLALRSGLARLFIMMKLPISQFTHVKL